MSLPSSMDNIVDNISSKDSLTYDDVRRRILELSGSSNLCSNGKALHTHSHKVYKSNNKKKNSEKPNPTRPGKTEPPKGNQASYCKKHKHPYESHTHKFCNRLKTARKGSTSSVPPPAPSRDVVANHANLTVNEEYNHVAAWIISSLPHPVPDIASGSAFKTAYDKTYEVCIFDTGASFHITADFYHLLEPIRCNVGLTVGGGTCLDATHGGSVQLDMEIGDSVLSVTLSDVLYVPHWNEACLISWTKIDVLGRFQIVGEDGIITVQRKSDHSTVFIAEFKYGCYQVLPLARPTRSLLQQLIPGTKG